MENQLTKLYRITPNSPPKIRILNLNVDKMRRKIFSQELKYEKLINKLSITTAKPILVISKNITDSVKNVDSGEIYYLFFTDSSGVNIVSNKIYAPIVVRLDETKTINKNSIFTDEPLVISDENMEKVELFNGGDVKKTMKQLQKINPKIKLEHFLNIETD